MLSLYIHIPFCRHKCKYCSFFVVPEDEAKPGDIESLKDAYTQELMQEISSYAQIYQNTGLKTLYIGGGTPFQLGPERLFQIIDTVVETWDCEHLEELSIELNPDPFDEVLTFIDDAAKKYKHLYKLRFSIGIQSFDDSILQQSKRNYVFNNLMGFLRELQPLRKHHHISFNGDFIAFGKLNDDGSLWDENRLEFFTNFVKSKTMDGFSVYTLELQPGSDWYNQNNKIAKQQSNKDAVTTSKIHRLQGNEDDIIEEFYILKQIIEKAGYKRYEQSNFAYPGKESLHNLVYWNMESYLGLGINASSFLNTKDIVPGLPEDLFQHKESRGVRFKNTHQWKQYMTSEKIDTESVECMSDNAFLSQQGRLALRTRGGIKQLSTYDNVLDPARENIVSQLVEQGFVTYEDDTLRLTEQGHDVYNTIVTELFTDFG